MEFNLENPQIKFFSPDLFLILCCLENLNLSEIIVNEQ
jgi:hypothetical protein